MFTKGEENMETANSENNNIKVVSFRLDYDSQERLLKRSKEKGVSPHEYVRQQLFKHLRNENEAKNLEEYVEKRFNKLEHMTKTVGLDLFFAVQKLLSHVTDSDIREWLKENMKALEWNIKES